MGCCLFDCIGGVVLTIFRWALFVFNVIFLVGGISLIVTGSLLLVNIGEVDDFISNDAEIGAIILITTGSISFLLAFLGCCGAIKKSPWMMNTYAGLLFVLFATQLAGGIVAFVYQDSLENGFKERLVYYGNNYDTEEFAKNAWDKLQSEQQCCGVGNFTDWQELFVPPRENPPVSCTCDEGSDGCGAQIPSNADIFYYTEGCYTKIQPFLRDMVLSTAGVGIGTALLQLVAGLFSLCLANRFKEKRRKGSH
ncbi:CD63 antigen-like [Cloeon dipterum]|uniref:CD63 antigen-like n=1 Tax=Cloeon dipterum TaxID=197152 RepID=UPI0032207143